VPTPEAVATPTPAPITGAVQPAPAPVVQRQPTPQPAAAPGPVNVNTADRETLMTLPGIGEVLADRIIQHRQTHGPFRRVEDLTAVSRIGERTAERLRPLVTF
jgi:competence protein ComEA